MSQDRRQNSPGSPPALIGARTTDPVCGLTVDRSEAVGTDRHAGTTYAFSNRDCRGGGDASNRRRASPLGHECPRWCAAATRVVPSALAQSAGMCVIC